MHPVLRSVPNTLTLIRIALVPVLWVLALMDESRMVAIGLAIAAITDILDGRLARALGQITPFGSKLDSIADSLVNFSAVGWLLLLEPDVVRDHPVFFSAVPVVAVGLLWMGWLKFRKVADFHLTSGRAAGVAGYLFLIQLFLFDRNLQPLLYVVMALAWIVAIEALMLLRGREGGEQRVSSPLVAYFAASTGRTRDRG
jgi:phosphatidylglycerophosphate synthase